MSTSTTLASRELDHRRGDGIDVKLLWDPHTDEVSVVVEDEQLGETFVLDVAGADALEAFRHPYAYAQRGRFEGLLAA